MRVLVTGADGQLGQALVAGGAARGLVMVAAGRTAMDLADAASIRACMARERPAVVLNAGAYTSVDKAESEAAQAYAVNEHGPGVLAASCAQAGARLIHVSTDYVYDGSKTDAYVEGDAPAPTGVYGASKLAGERAVRQALPEALILRTAWVYAATGRNFLLTMLNAARRTRTLKVVADQTGCPTAAGDLAAVMLDLAGRAGWQGGIFHAAGAGATSWHGFACAIFEEAARYGLEPPEVLPIATADWPTPARRPANSRLDCTALRDAFGLALPPWRDAVARVVGEAMGESMACR